MKQLFEILPSEWAEKFSKTMKERIELSFTNEDVISLIESKVGGRGYLPKEQGYPVNEGGEPLFFLAQINFAEMPQIENYPKSGILAFYVDYHDDLYGLNFDDQTEQNGFRVFFFENLDRECMTREEQAVYFEGIDKSALYTVVKGEYKLAGRVTKELLMNDILEFEKEFGSGFYDIMEQIFGEDEDKANELFDLATYSSQIGGFPFFTQEDPRMRTENSYHDTLLFQLDSEYSEEPGAQINIMWGMSGVGNFFINKQDLINRDFSNVIFNWDC
ncbi:DUF1963 domain-containing protein [Listeria monocytogenes]|uniref:YwqG family protein n=1 Tax=Listeria monocytogenes TaxID=1639 RepID=UPI00085C3937|nr:YwqG family protein [Listeria monocytogenes]EAD7632241.1 DUF1963 domain-containing protein [Listeria monocytogenes]EAE1349236.1 DUF1963 domain-containing protein [Listeria monocytogenes]EAG9490008.1 DUF1963 domain-containing protein [Listeria monocytogenes]EBD1474170.1 DUF1963 domain-containing protein [Listeria monocytogenes]EFQ9070504.1 DUF1963 domain-containing protein [Listeria monocytogenes]